LEVGFIGLGRMGRAMACNLLAAGHELAVHDAAARHAAALAGHGARIAPKLAEVCNADAVITMLESEEDMEAIVFGGAGVLAAMPAGATHVAMSAIGIALARRLAVAHRRAGQSFVAAPVLGSPESAAEGNLFILAAGDAAAVARCRPLFAALAQRSFLLGSEHAAASLLHGRLAMQLAEQGDAGLLEQLIEAEVGAHRRR
jgi:3-hydroxyisobutyrate dehydrogenase-like beta-hydroxyacid dehydrogenase